MAAMAGRASAWSWKKSATIGWARAVWRARGRRRSGVAMLFVAERPAALLAAAGVWLLRAS